MLICPKCGHDNPLGRIFCHSCGDKLDLNRIKPPSAAEKKRRQIKRGAKRTVRIALELVIGAALVLAIVLICLTPEIPPVQPTNDELVASDAKRVELEKLTSNRKSGQVTMSAGEVNAIFNQKPFAKPTGADVLVAPVLRRATLRDGRVKLEILATAHLGTVCDKALYFAYEGQPLIVAGQFVFKPTGAWLGQLPLDPRLPFLMPLFEQRIVSLLQELTGDQPLLDKLAAINVTPQAVEFVVSAPPAH